MSTKVAAYATQTAKTPFAPFTIDRREPGAMDVAIDIEYCGVCHSDLHTARGEWPGCVFPVVPGHEIVGRVSFVGSKVTKFKVGDTAAVGCMVGSCRSCANCRESLEQFCEKGMGPGGTVFTYNSPDPDMPGQMTYGGYSKHIVVREDFVLRVPKGLDKAAAAPLLCAGITTYSPLKHWGCDEPGKGGRRKKVGIVGLGGLGHMGLKFAHAFGCETALFTTSESKIADGKRLGADHVIISKDADAMGKHANSFDFILNTVAASHNLDQYTNLLRAGGAEGTSTMCLVGVPEHPHPSPMVFPLIFKRCAIAGSLIGGIRETQEMLDYCGTRGIVSDIEMIKMQDIEAAYTRMLKSDVKYRFVIDMASLK